MFVLGLWSLNLVFGKLASYVNVTDCVRLHSSLTIGKPLPSNVDEPIAVEYELQYKLLKWQNMES